MPLNVHFVLTSGKIGPCEQRALLSAKVHQAPITLWFCGTKPEVFDPEIRLEPIVIPEGYDSIHPARLFDVIRWQILHEHGGLILGLDTISLRPAWDLLREFEIVVSRDWWTGDQFASEENLRNPYNDPILVTRGSELAIRMYRAATEDAHTNPADWGLIGPALLSRFIREHPDKISGCAYPELCGFGPGYIWRFYLGHELPPPNARVIHLYKQAYLALYERRYLDWAKQHPAYAGEVYRRTDLNERLLRCP